MSQQHVQSENEQNQKNTTHVQINNLVKIYNDEVLAVDDISIDIKEGEFMVFVGPSGCGKTTTLRSVAGLETLTSGEIVINDEVVNDLDPRQRDIAMVFQNYALYPHKTVRENMAFPLEIRNYETDTIKDQVNEAASLLDISEMLDRKPKELSGGQQQRVALGRAIVREPSVFLFDEPLSNLDAKLRVQMRTELNKLHKRIGKTTIYVTHDQAEALTLADRVVVLNNGTIQQISPPQDVYDKPVNQFVAGFIGEPSMNFLPITVHNTGNEARYISDMFNIDAPKSMQSNENISADDSGYIFGIRPEDLYDSSLSENSGKFQDTFNAYIKVIEPLGADKFITLSKDSESADPEITARISPQSDLEEGDEITLGADVSKSHLFDSSGQNVTHDM